MLAVVVFVGGCGFWVVGGSRFLGVGQGEEGMKRNWISGRDKAQLNYLKEKKVHECFIFDREEGGKGVLKRINT